jgi:hypothetical protein
MRVLVPKMMTMSDRDGHVMAAGEQRPDELPRAPWRLCPMPPPKARPRAVIAEIIRQHYAVTLSQRERDPREYRDVQRQIEGTLVRLRIYTGAKRRALLEDLSASLLAFYHKCDALDTAVHRTREQMLAHFEPLQILLSAFYPRRKRYLNDFTDLEDRLRAIPAERYGKLNRVAHDLLGQAKTELIEAMWQALKRYGQEGYARRSRRFVDLDVSETEPLPWKINHYSIMAWILRDQGLETGDIMRIAARLKKRRERGAK